MSVKMHELRDVVGTTIHVDEYQAKMGDDDDIIVFSFKVKYKDQAQDLVNFLEIGYDWILDADVSSGEMHDGSYLVFLETLRRPSIPVKLIRLLDDLTNITDIPLKDYKFSYKEKVEKYDFTIENLQKHVPLSPREYRLLNNKKDDVDESIDILTSNAGISSIPRKTTKDKVLTDFVNLSKQSKGR